MLFELSDEFRYRILLPPTGQGWCIPDWQQQVVLCALYDSRSGKSRFRGILWGGDGTGTDVVHTTEYKSPDRIHNRFEMYSLVLDKHISTCDKLFLSSLSIKENDTDTNDVILPIKKPLMNVLESVNLYLNARLLCRHMHLLKQQELLLVLRGFYTKKELAAFFSASTNIRESFERFVWITIEKQIRSRNLPTCTIYQSDLLTESFILVLGKAPINGYRRKKRDIYRKWLITQSSLLKR